MTDQMHHYLVVYFARTGEAKVEDLGIDDQRAAERYSEVEEMYVGRTDVEVVLIGADSLETIRRTHAHYFERAGNGTSLRSQLIARTGTGT